MEVEIVTPGSRCGRCRGQPVAQLSRQPRRHLGIGEQRRGAPVIARAEPLSRLPIGVAQMFDDHRIVRSEEHTSELQSLMRISYAVFCLKKKTQKIRHTITITNEYK